MARGGLWCGCVGDICTLFLRPIGFIVRHNYFALPLAFRPSSAVLSRLYSRENNNIITPTWTKRRRRRNSASKLGEIQINSYLQQHSLDINVLYVLRGGVCISHASCVYCTAGKIQKKHTQKTDDPNTIEPYNTAVVIF